LKTQYYAQSQDKWHRHCININSIKSMLIKRKEKAYYAKNGRDINKLVYFFVNSLTLKLQYLWMQDYLMIFSAT